jgi:hypothetical protein
MDSGGRESAGAMTGADGVSARFCCWASRNRARVIRLACVRNGFSGLGGAATIAARLRSSSLRAGTIAAGGAMSGTGEAGLGAGSTGTATLTSSTHSSSGRLRLRSSAAPASPASSRDPPPKAHRRAGSIPTSDGETGARVTGGSGSAGTTTLAGGGGGEDTVRSTGGSARYAGAAGSAARAIGLGAGLGAARFSTTGGAASTFSALDAAIAASSRCSTEGVGWITGCVGAKTGAGATACGSAWGTATVVSTDGATVCADKAGALRARTAAIAALAGRIERMFPVIGRLNPRYSRFSAQVFRDSGPIGQKCRRID